MSELKTGKGVAVLCPSCGGEGKCGLCAGYGTVSQELHDTRVAVMDRDAENDRLRTLNAKLLTACKMYDDEWTAAFPAGPQVSAGRLCRNTIAIWEAMREVIAEAEKGATP